MSSVDLKDAAGQVFSPKVYNIDDAGKPVVVQTVSNVDSSGAEIPVARDDTLSSVQSAVVALKASVDALSAKLLKADTDNIGGTVAISGGVEVTNDAGNPLPVLLPTFNTIPDNQVDAPATRLVGEDIWTCSFTDTIAAGIASQYWLERSLGIGVGRSQVSGTFRITTGTTINAEYLARSLVSWRSSMSLRYKFTASQRIANQNFAILLADKVGESLACVINSATSISVTKTGHGYTSANVGQFMFVGGISGAAGVPGRYAIASIPNENTINFTVAGWPASGSCTLDLFGHSYVRNLYNGTTATNSLFDTQRKGWNNGDTTATINTTASGHLGQFVNDGRNVFFSDMVVTSATTPNVTTRASKYENLPDDNLNLFIYLWSYNGTIAPASTTTWTLGFVSVECFANLPVFVQGQKMQGTSSPLPVAVTSAPSTTVTGTVTSNEGTPVTPTASLLNSAAGTNGTVVKATAGNVYGVALCNNGAGDAYFKLHNSATVTVGTTAVALWVKVAANSSVFMEFGSKGMRYGTGICYSVTGGIADNDTTGVLAGQVKVNLAYI